MPVRTLDMHAHVCVASLPCIRSRLHSRLQATPARNTLMLPAATRGVALTSRFGVSPEAAALAQRICAGEFPAERHLGPAPQSAHDTTLRKLRKHRRNEPGTGISGDPGEVSQRQCGESWPESPY